MTNLFARGAMRVRVCSIGIPLLAVVIIAALARPAHSAETIKVRLDQARIAKLPDRVATLVVGNPLIADVSLQQGGLMVLTGKGYGTTNLVALDRGGNILSDQLIEVQGPNDAVVVFRGANRESYSCTPNCERRITLGDFGDYFDATLGQAATRNRSAIGGAGPQAPAAK